MNPRISVIIPVYNAAAHLHRSVESVQAQTFQNWELILVDDGSKDDSLQLCMKYKSHDSRIIVIHQKNMGPGITRNNAMSHANGDYIVFIDSDDYVAPDYFALLNTHDEDVVFVDANHVDGNGKVIGRDVKSIYSSATKDSILRFQMAGRMTWGSWGMCVKRQMFIENDIKFSHHKRGEEAQYSFMLLWHAKTIGFIDKPVYNYVLWNGSQSHIVMDDPMGDVALNFRSMLQSNGLYERFADTINAFILSAGAISANCLACNHSYIKYIRLVSARRTEMYSQFNKSYGVDYSSMSLGYRLVGRLLQLRLYNTIWLLSKMRSLVK